MSRIFQKIRNTFHKMRYTSDYTYYIYGKHCTLLALNNANRKILKILCTKKLFNEHKNQLSKFKVQILDSKTISSIIGIDYNHQGLACLTTRTWQNISNKNLQQLHDTCLILDQITDPQNLGTIIRNAAAFGVKEIIIPSSNAAKENGTVVKCSAGYTENVTIFTTSNIHNIITQLKKHAFWIVGLDIQGTLNINSISDIKKIACIIGSEHAGIRPLTKKHCDYLLNIKTTNIVNSLNAGTASGIFLHQIFNRS